MKISKLIAKEVDRQRNTIMLIPSENYAYKEVREAVGSPLMHKYSEGYPGKRYYAGNKFIDQIEEEGLAAAKKLFGVPYANIQPLSGSPANSAVYMALLSPGDTIMGLSLASGGHLTHGHPKITFSGKFFNSIQYEIEKDGSIDFEKLRAKILEHKPKILIVGTTAYPKILDFKKFYEAAKDTDTLVLADISHIVGLVAAGLHPSPVPYAHIITSTTHKMLRGPRGAMILVTDLGIKKDPELPKKIDRAVFPGLQGGPHNNVTAGIAIALQKANTQAYKKYGQRVLENAKVLSSEFSKLNYTVVTGGTENHLLLLDLRNKGIGGKEASEVLDSVGIVVNANAIPFDPASPLNPSGIRLGSPAVTARGMGTTEMKKIVSLIDKTLSSIGNKKELHKISKEVKAICKKFPVDF